MRRKCLLWRCALVYERFTDPVIEKKYVRCAARWLVYLMNERLRCEPWRPWRDGGSQKVLRNKKRTWEIAVPPLRTKGTRGTTVPDSAIKMTRLQMAAVESHAVEHLFGSSHTDLHIHLSSTAPSVKTQATNTKRRPCQQFTLGYVLKSYISLHTYTEKTTLVHPRTWTPACTLYTSPHQNP